MSSLMDGLLGRNGSPAVVLDLDGSCKLILQSSFYQFAYRFFGVCDSLVPLLSAFVDGGLVTDLLDLFARFITGFFLGSIPWYIGAFLLLCVRMDYREKPGLIACTIGVSVFNLFPTDLLFEKLIHGFVPPTAEDSIHL